MIYPLSPTLMELLVLSFVMQEDSYGYKISQQLKKVSNLKDSALYPALRKLSENQYVDVYDRQFQGRNRKYYKITEAGRQQQQRLEKEWHDFTKTLDDMISQCHKAEGREDDEERVYGAAQSKAETAAKR